MNPQDQPSAPNNNQPPTPEPSPQPLSAPPLPSQPSQPPAGSPSQAPGQPAQPLSSQLPVDPLLYLQPSTPNYQRPVLIVGGVMLILLILAGIGMSMLGNTTPSPSQQSKTPAGANSGDANSQAAVSSQAPAGYVPLEKLCYTVHVPKDNDAGAENDCVFSARFGEEKLTSMTVSHFVKYNENIDSNVANFKATESKSGSTIVGEENLKVGGIDARKIVTKGKGAYALTTAHIFVGTNKYKVDGVSVTGFEIIAPSYDLAENKVIIDNIITSWQWK